MCHFAGNHNLRSVYDTSNDIRLSNIKLILICAHVKEKLFPKRKNNILFVNVTHQYVMRLGIRYLSRGYNRETTSKTNKYGSFPGCSKNDWNLDFHSRGCTFLFSFLLLEMIFSPSCIVPE